MTYKDKKIGIVVPAYNEEKLIGRTLSTIPDYVDKVYVVDDCSTDRTSEIAKEFARDPKFVCIRHEVNKGVGAGIISGYKKAIKDEMDIVAVMAGDNQMDPEQLPGLFDPIVNGRADYTKGNRLLSSEYRRGMSKWRTLGNSMLTFLTKVGSGYWHITDPQNGYTAISIKALKMVDPDTIYPWYGYCNDLLVRLNVYSLRVQDVIMPARYGEEKSKIRYGKYIPKVAWLLLKDFFWRLKMKYVIFSFHPLVLFYMLGIFLVPVSIFCGLYSLYYKLIINGSIYVRGTISLLLFIIGLQFLLFAMLFDMQEVNAVSRDMHN